MKAMLQLHRGSSAILQSSTEFWQLRRATSSRMRFRIRRRGSGNIDAVQPLPTSPLLLSHSPCFYTPLRGSGRAVHIEHSSDIHKWRNPEKAAVQRHFRGGVKLGSEFAKIREQEQLEKKMIAEDKFTNWRIVYGFALGSALLLFALNLLLAFVEPNPSPEYVPYVDSPKSRDTAGADAAASRKRV